MKNVCKKKKAQKTSIWFTLVVMLCQKVSLLMVGNLLANTSNASTSRANEGQNGINIILGKEPYLMERAEMRE